MWSRRVPGEVVAADIFEFVVHQRGDRTVVRISDGESGLSARTIARRVSSVSGLYAYLVARGDTSVRSNPVPRGLSARRRRGRRQLVPLVRVPRMLPRILSPGEVAALLGALRSHRDRAMVYAMVLGDLRRCEVLGLRLGDVQVPERSLFIADGKGGHQRILPISNTFFLAIGDYLHPRTPRGLRHRPGVRHFEGPEPRPAGDCRWGRQDPPGCPSARLAGTGDLSSVAPHLFDPVAKRAWLSRPSRPRPATSRSLESTRIYLRIADRVLVNEYAAVTAQVDALYNTAGIPSALPAEIETAAMTRLRKESHARMLGNGSQWS